MFCLAIIWQKPYTKLNTDEILSLDILSLVPVTDLTDIRWIDHNVQYLCDLLDPTYW
jgi:hypothetical protein